MCTWSIQHTDSKYTTLCIDTAAIGDTLIDTVNLGESIVYVPGVYNTLTQSTPHSV